MMKIDMDKISVMNKARAEYRREHEFKVVQAALSFYEDHKEEPLFIAGITLYWAEGKKVNDNWRCQLSISNSEPKLLQVYCNFLRKYISPDKSLWRVELFLYPDINEARVKSFWARTLGIPKFQFIKSQVLNGKETKRKLPYGTCCIYINGKDYCLRVKTWIECFGNARLLMRE